MARLSICAVGRQEGPLGEDPVKGAISTVANAWSSMGLSGGDPRLVHYLSYSLNFKLPKRGLYGRDYIRDKYRSY